MPIFQVAIAVPELYLHVSSACSGAASAARAACLALEESLQQLRNFHLTFPDPGRSTALAVETAHQFLDFYIQTSCRLVSLKLSHKKNFSRMPGFVHTAVQIGDRVCDTAAATISEDVAAKFAMLAMVIQLVNEDPNLVPEFQQALQRNGGKMPRPMSPVPLHLPSSVLGLMETVTNPFLDQDIRPQGRVAMLAPTETDGRPFSLRRLPEGPRKRALNKDMQQRLGTLKTASTLEGMRQHLDSLPMSQYRGQVLAMIQDLPADFSIVVGATGSGKTTQVPQILLDDAVERGAGADCNIICTQPRRIAATSVAVRVAAERGQPLGENVGYQVRFDSRPPRPHGSITFCTTGVLLAQLKADADGVMNYASHILIDEVHERDLLTDFLVAMVKNAVKSRRARGLPVPKVVLMSATLDTELFANYLGSPNSPGSAMMPAPSISVPGRTFPVQTRFLDEIMSDLNESHPSELQDLLRSDPKLTEYLVEELHTYVCMADVTEETDPENESSSDQTDKTDTKYGSRGDILAAGRRDEYVPIQAVAAVIARICETTQAGAILAFLPGLREINETHRALINQDIFNLGFRNPFKYRIHLLHSMVPREEQAATSVTVPDVQHVIDAGKLREKRYDQLTGIGGLTCVWESKSNSKQREGRAGRVQNGFYYALFSRARYAEMAPVGLPEVLRVDLQETCLAIKKLHYQQNHHQPIAEVLAEFIQPPPTAAVMASVQHLKRLKALTEDEQLTPLGRLLADIPVHPTLAKMIVMGIIFRCLDPMIILGAAACDTRLFFLPREAREEARAAHREWGGHASDHISMLSAYDELRSCRSEYGEEMARDRAITSFLRWDLFLSIHKNAVSILDVLVKRGIVSAGDNSTASQAQYGPPSLNTNSASKELIRALLVAGLYPNLAAGGSVGKQFKSKDEGRIIIHPTSQNAILFIGKPRSSSFAELRPRATSLITFSQLETMDSNVDALFARDTTIVPPLTTVLFANDGVESDDESLVQTGGWLPFTVKNVLATEEEGEEDAGGRVLDDSRDSVRHSLHVLLRFKSLLDTMLNRAYSDLSKLQMLHYEEFGEEEEEEEEGQEPLSSPTPLGVPRLTKPPISPLDLVDDSLLTIMTNAVLVVLDDIEDQPAPPEEEEDTTATSTAVTTNTTTNATTQIVTERRARRAMRPQIEVKAPQEDPDQPVPPVEEHNSAATTRKTNGIT
ncbi:P-loop containing nucleoside triphosphate hydrolase protein [Apiospora aurea]|uniref:RNA helicase n=1 Tax=Apiospora aurea TaxID=335848 RepID=A0ABR1QT31_9PEZI